jgi:hypothetical protein
MSKIATRATIIHSIVTPRVFQVLGGSLLFALVILWLLWPGFQQQAAMQWDASEIYLPWKFFITEQLKGGHWPLWNPYTTGGFPQHGDPGTWYEISWLLGLLGTYNLQTLLLEYAIHLYIAALGMYFLIQQRGLSWQLCAAGGILYAFNGFFIGNAQHLGWVIGMAWFPWIVFFVKRLIANSNNNTTTINNILGLSVVVHCQFTGGYLGITAITLYVVVFMVLVELYIRRKAIGKSQIWGLVKHFGAAVVVFSMLSANAILGLWDLQSLITRSQSLSLSEFQFGEWPWGAWKTMFFQPADIDFANSLGADVSLINLHWGLIPVLMGCYYLISRLWSKPSSKHTQFVVYFLLGCLFLLISAGAAGLIHAGVVSRLPLLQLFRFPSMYRGFAMFFWLYSIFVLIQGQSTTKPWISWAFAVSMVLEMGWYAHQNRFNTLFAQIPANQVNEVLDDCVNREHRTISGLPWRLPVDTQQHWNEQIPFMNQNQGIYLKIWASDGYNPYRFKSGENNAVQGDSQGGAILGLNAKGHVVKGGILSCKQVEVNGEQIQIQGLKFDTAVTDIVIMQTPHKFWNQQGESMGEGWCNYKNCGMKMKAQTHVNLKYEPKYFAMGIVFWIFGWLMILAVVLKFNAIRFSGWVRRKKR